jgi:predicted NACHT family NTPase
LYNRAIDLAAQYIVDLAPNLPDYTDRNFTEVLMRLDISMSKLDEILADLENLRAISAASNRRRLYADFEADYRASIVRKLDRVNLFGADVSRTLKRYRLTVAYVSLEVGYSERNGESGDRIPVERALARTSRSAIIGEAGSGKTTLLQWLAVNSAANSFGRELSSFGHTVPFLIELRRYVEDPPPPEDFITQIVPEIADQMPDLWVHDILKSGRALLLVDGLDEVAPNKRETVLDWLDSIVFSYPDVTVVFTSRPAAYERGWLDALGFEEFILAPMRYPDIEMFVNYWHKAVLVDQDLETDEEAMIMGMKLLEKLRNSLP